MTKFLATACLTAVVLLGLAQVSDANCRGGIFRRPGCGTPCQAPCATTEVEAPKFEERKVNVLKQVMKEKEIDVLECKRVTKEEKYEYQVCVPVWKEEKRKVTVCTPTTREVDYEYKVAVPKVVEKKVQCTTYNCVRENIVEKVPVCRTVCVTYVDECGRCCTRRERVTEWREQTRCVVKRVPVITEQTVKVTVCDWEVRKGKKTVCEIVRTEKDQMVKVCTHEMQKREGTRLVCSTVTEKVKRKVMVCETVEEEKTIRVQVGGARCDSHNDCHGHRTLFRGGLFHRGGCCN